MDHHHHIMDDELTNKSFERLAVLPVNMFMTGTDENIQALITQFRNVHISVSSKKLLTFNYPIPIANLQMHRYLCMHLQICYIYAYVCM